MHRPMKRLKILGFAGALVASAIVGGTLMSTVLANPGTPAAAASSLHLSVDQLKTRLKGGESLKQIAKDQNVDYATVTTAIKSAAKTDLDKVVKAGTISEDRENAILDRIDKALQNGRLWNRPD